MDSVWLYDHAILCDNEKFVLSGWRCLESMILLFILRNPREDKLFKNNLVNRLLHIQIDLFIKLSSVLVEFPFLLRASEAQDSIVTVI